MANSVESVHTDEIPPKGALIKVVQCEHADSSANKKPAASQPPQRRSTGSRRRASTLGVIAELPAAEVREDQNEDEDEDVIEAIEHTIMFAPTRPKSRNPSSSSLHNSKEKDASKVVAGQIKAFGDDADKAQFKIEDRVVLHPGDTASSTVFVRNVEYRMISDLSFLVPISQSVPFKLAVLLGGRGLSLFSAVKAVAKHVDQQNSCEKLKILVVCNDEFSMLSVQLLDQVLFRSGCDTNGNKAKKANILVALATMRDDGIIWYKKNLPKVKHIQWNADAYDQVLVERTRDACGGEVDLVLGCVNLGSPLQRSVKCLKKGGTAFVTEETNEKVWKMLEKFAGNQSKEIVKVERGPPDDLKHLVELVIDEKIHPAFLQEDNMTIITKHNQNMRRKALSFGSRTPVDGLSE